MLFLSFVFALLSCGLFIGCALGQFDNVDGQPAVTVSQGLLLGKYRVTQRDTKYASFEGIPYAEPPIGDLRFRAPQELKKWPKFHNGTELGPHCVQPIDSFGSTIVINEDCLLINVYTPIIEKCKKIPVMVYIHGGAFKLGPGITNVPEFLLDACVIVVTIAFRLGVLGFLCLNTIEVPGNAGMKDQALALKWIKENIHFFNGDNENITLYGESSGGVSTLLLQLSPLSRDLFHKIISMSGNSLSGWAIQEYPKEKAAKLGEILGIDSNSTAFVSNLKKLDAYDITTAGVSVPARVPGNIEDFVFTPCIERIIPVEDAFLTMLPIEYYKANNFREKPMIIGYSSKEFTYFFITASESLINNKDSLNKILNNPYIVVPDKWQKKMTPCAIEKVYREIIYFFFKNEQIDLTKREIVEKAIDLLGDVFIVISTDEIIRVLSIYNKKSIYHYRFSFRGVINSVFMDPVGIQGATHLNEMSYLIQSEGDKVGVTTPDGWTRRRIVELYSKFAKCGNPTPGPYDNLIPLVWEPVEPQHKHYLEINGDLTSSIDPDKIRIEFWRSLKGRVENGYYNACVGELANNST